MSAVLICVYRFKRYGTLLLLNFFILPCFSQNAKEDPEARLKQDMPDTARITLLKNLSSSRSPVLPQKKFYYANQLKQLAEKINNGPAIADAYINMGIAEAMRSKYDSSIYYFTMGYNQAQKAHYEQGMGRSLVNTGFAYDHLDDGREAIKYYSEALAIFKKINMQKGIDQCNTNIGSIYYDLGQHQTAKSYFQQCLDSYTRTHDETGVGNALYSLGNCAQAMGDDKTALDYFNRSMAIRQKKNDINGIGLAHRGLGIVYMHLKQYDTSVAHLLTGLKNIQTIGDKYEEAALLDIIVKAYVAKKDFDTAEKYAMQGVKIGYTMKNKSIAALALRGLVATYNGKKDVANAYKYQTVYVLTEDSILADKELENVTLSEFNRMHTENASLAKNNQDIKSKNTDYAQRISHYSDVIVSTSITLVCVILLSLVLYRRNLEKQASNKLLSEQKEEIANINHELEALNEELSTQIELTHAQNSELERLNAIKNKFFSIISHDLRGPLNTLRSLFAIYRDGDIQEEEMAMMLNRLEDTILTTGEFLDNLLEWSKSQLEGIVINPVDFDISATISNNIHLFDSKINEKQLKVINLAREPVMVHADQNMVALVIRNLLSNSVKFCRPGNEISLSAKANNNRALIAIHDTGPGFSEADKEKLFSLEHIVTTGAQGEKGNHLGLILCRDMVVQNNGRIWLESNPGEGSTFWIELPLA